MKKKIILLVNIVVCGILDASRDNDISPISVARNVSDNNIQDLPKINDKDDNDDNDLTFFDAQENLPVQGIMKNEEKHSPIVQNNRLFQDIILTPKDITVQDEYYGYDSYFDQLYQVAKRDIYVSQQNEKLFPNRRPCYENLKKYYIKLGQQRKDMAALKQFMGPEISKLFDRRQYNQLSIEPKAAQILVNIDKKRFVFYHNNVVKLSKSLIDYKIPLLPGVVTDKQPQIQLNELDLLKARIMVDQLQKFQKKIKFLHSLGIMT